MCAVCHGAHGEGYRADGAPALAHPDFLVSVSDDFLDFAIAMGRQHTTMSAWRTDQGGPLTAADVRALIALLRSWEGPPVALDEAYVHGDAARGKAIFGSTCSGCHGPKGSSIHLLNRQWLVHAKPAFMRYAIAHGRPSTKMVGYADSLGAEGVEDVMAYLKTQPNWLVPGEIAGSIKPPPIPLGPVPLNPRGPMPKGFHAYPESTRTKVVWAEFHRGARMAFLDARTSSDYLTSHIEGAVSVPFYDPTPYLEALPKTAWLVAYCGCPQAESGALARQLLDAGFSKVTVLEEGFGAWTSAGHPIHTGRLP
jgi:mono/diheme cytochrome c family protein/rhodanese-related sulfurtransferase